MSILIPLWLIFWVATFLVAAKKGNALSGLFIGALLGPIGLIIALVSGDANRTPCPQCHEQVMRRALVCPHCKAKLSGAKRSYQVTGIAIVALVIASSIIGRNATDKLFPEGNSKGAGDVATPMTPSAASAETRATIEVTPGSETGYVAPVVSTQPAEPLPVAVPTAAPASAPTSSREEVQRDGSWRADDRATDPPAVEMPASAP